MTPPAFDWKTEAKKLLRLLPGPVFYALFRLAFLWPHLTETVYARTLFPAVNRPLSALTGLAPFSLGECLLYAFLLFAAAFAVLTVVAAIRARRAWWQPVLRRVRALLIIASALYALFVGLWGFNYARLPLSHTFGLDASPATVDELYATCDALVKEANRLRADVPEDRDGVFAPSLSRADIMRAAAAYYDAAAADTGLSFLGGGFGPVKPVLYSSGLSWAHIAGVYFPFTGEANVNTQTPMLLFPASCLHEAAHQRGFAREDEANFLAYYVAARADDISVRYSGTVLALVYAMDALYHADSDLYYGLRAAYAEGVVRDLADHSRFWQRYEGAISEAAVEVNNTFLKANMQRDGVQSYGRMVDLLIGLWRRDGI